MIFAGAGCVHQWMLRSSTSYLRQAVFERDRGVCAGCGLNAPVLADVMRRLPTTNEAADRRGLPMSREGWLASLGFARADVFHGSLWQADHIVPVERGGGLCGLDGMQTLCSPCHRRKSAAERAR